MRVRNLLLISIVAVCMLLAGCTPYQYQESKEIPVSVAEDGKAVDVQGDEGFKSEFEKLQKLLEEEGAADKADKEAAEEAEAAVEDVVEEAAAEDIVEEETAEEDTEESAEEDTTEKAAEETETVDTVPSGATKITVKEGELINLAIESDDPDADSITYTFTSPLDAKGKWQTDFGDAGVYKTTITASDGELSTSQDVYLVVEKVSRAPVITSFADMTVNEGETIELKPKVTDPEGGSVSLEYSGWMTSSKKTVSYTDAGSYEVTLTATGESGESATATITITVLDKNRPPTILSITNK
jgi:hypothetical protein